MIDTKAVLKDELSANSWQLKALYKMMKNAFHFTIKPPFVLKISNFLSWIFGHVEKQLD